MKQNTQVRAVVYMKRFKFASPLFRGLALLPPHPHVHGVDLFVEPLDDALITWFAAPRSYTGDEVVEIATHGGHVVPALVLAACVAAGAPRGTN